MKTSRIPISICLLSGLLIVGKTALAAEASVEAGVNVTATVKLPYGVDEVLKLSRAKIGEDVIVSYVQSSGTVYQLTPKDILYLRDQGVSEHVISAMLDQRRPAEATSYGQPSASAGVPTPEAAPQGPAYSGGEAPSYAPPVEEVQAPVSTLHIIPYYSTSYLYRPYTVYSYPYPYPVYRTYGAPCYRSYGYCGSVRYYAPSVTFRFGGGRGHFHSFHR
jgi:hypothetical protein